MHTIKVGTRGSLLIVGLPLAVLAGLALVIVLTVSAGSGGKKAEAATDSSIDFSISTSGCDSSGTPTATCSVAAGATFTLALNLNHLPSNGNYDGYDAKLDYTSGLTTGPSGLHQTGAGNWPDCVFTAPDFTTTPGEVVLACAIGVPPATSSTYTGALFHLDFACGSSPSTESLTLVAGGTDTVDSSLAAHSEAADESLTINCGGGGGTPTETPTPCVDCPTPTETPVPPTPTPVTPTPTLAGLCGDANGDGTVNSLDAFFALQYDAGLITSLPRPELADADGDGYITSLDALIMLQINAGLVSGC